MSRPRTIHLVDGSGQFYRAFHAIRGLATSRGLPTNATYGFTTMLRKMLQDERPEHVAVLFDPPGKTFRHEQYADYKANRPLMDNDLAVQIPYIRRVCEAFRLPIVEVPGFEADDVIAALAEQAVAAGFKVVVVTADKDMLQLVDENVVVLNPGREGTGSTLLDKKAVEEKWGVPPERVVDVLALVGDSIDNVPGVPGIGEKGARDLVKEYGPVEAVIANADKVKRAAYREGLENHAAEALLSKQLVTLRRDVPVTLDLDAIVCREPDVAACHALFKELEFQALAKEYTPQIAAGSGEHRLLLDRGAIEAAVAEVRACGKAALAVVVTSGQAMRATALGVAFACRPGESYYVPLAHTDLDAQGALPATEALALLRPLLEDPAVRKASAQGKRDRIVLGRLGVALEGLAFDAMLASYLVDPGRRIYALEDLAFEYLGERRAPAGDGIVSADASAGAMASAAGTNAEVVLRLDRPLCERLRQEELLTIYESMEVPLLAVLADMERAGVRVDTQLLAGMSRDMEAQLESLTAEIHRLAKGEFNINSPIQLREVLFERLGLKSAKKTAKTRAASTAEDVLEELALVHELPRKILDYRSVQKLKSTYVDALPGLVNPRDGPHPRDLQPDGGCDRPAVLDRPQPAEHPDPHRGGPAHPRGLRGRAWPPAALGGLQPDRAARARAPLEGPDAGRHLPPRRGRARPHLARDLRADLAGARRPTSAASRRWSTTPCSTGRAPSRWRRTSASTESRPRRSSPPTSRATPACAASSTTRSCRPARAAPCARCSAACAACRTCARRTSRCAWKPSARP